MTNQAQLIQKLEAPTKRVLFLGYTSDQTKIIDDLINANCEVWHTQEKIETTCAELPLLPPPPRFPKKGVFGFIGFILLALALYSNIFRFYF